MKQLPLDQIPLEAQRIADDFIERVTNLLNEQVADEGECEELELNNSDAVLLSRELASEITSYALKMRQDNSELIDRLEEEIDDAEREIGRLQEQLDICDTELFDLQREK